jgi:hypothetical protein
MDRASTRYIGRLEFPGPADGGAEQTPRGFFVWMSAGSVGPEG